MGEIPPQLAIFMSATMFFVIVRAADIQIFCKNCSQRTKREQSRMDRGLFRSFLLELMLFVPISAGLVLMMIPPALPLKIAGENVPQFPLYATLGIASYGFPFATLRSLVTRAALNTLKEFASIAPPAEVELQEGD